MAFEELSFPEVYTAQEVAAKLHVSGWQLAKVVMAKVDGELAMLVLPAPAMVDFSRLKEALEAREVELAREMDESLAEAGEIVFLAGKHNEALKLSYADYERLAQPRVLNFACLKSSG